MTLQQAAQTYSVAGLEHAALDGQEEAFQTCLTFLEGVEKTKGQNRWRGSYGLKHVVENPPYSFGIPSSSDCYNGYIYEGTFILAALASGFTMRQRGNYLTATFNISERSLQKKAREFAKQCAHRDTAL